MTAPSSPTSPRGVGTERLARWWRTYHRIAKVVDWLLFAATLGWTVVAFARDAGDPTSWDWVLAAACPIGLALAVLDYGRAVERFASWVSVRLVVGRGNGVRRARIG